MTNNLIVLKPANEAFEYQPVTENKICYNVEYPESGGMLVYYQGHPYPEKLFPFPEAFYVLDAVKRSVINAMGLLRDSWTARFWFGLICLMPGHNKLMFKAAEKYFDFTMCALSKIAVKPKYYCKSGREFYRAGLQTLEQLDPKGKHRTMGEQMIKMLCIIWEMDNAYRYRGQDWMGILDQEFFKRKPIKALQLMFEEAARRETTGLADKWKMFKKIISLAMLNKHVRRIVMTFVNNLNFNELYLDTADKYWCYHFENYNVQGLDLMTRLAMRAHMNPVDKPVVVDN